MCVLVCDLLAFAETETEREFECECEFDFLVSLAADCDGDCDSRTTVKAFCRYAESIYFRLNLQQLAKFMQFI